jgi:glycosyltransferase involved in cell wall biosynthesis
LKRGKILSQEQENNLLKNHIIFTNNTLAYERINDLFNAADLYISPYLAEGFNLTVLESISAGLPVLVPETGSTKEYIDDLSINFSDYIVKLKSSIVTDDSGKSQNNYDVNELYNTLVNNKTKINSMKTKRYNNYESLHDYIEKNYSWNHVSYLLFKYLKNIVKGKY